MHKSIKLRLALAVALVMHLAGLVRAADGEDPEKESDWEIMLAAGVGVVPVYEGSVDYGLVPIPYAYVNWKDFIILGPNGLNANLMRNDTFKAGLGLTVSSGRDEEGNTFFGSKGNNDLRGMGDINPAAGVRAFASYEFPQVTLDGGVVQYIGKDNDGLLANVSLSRTFTLMEVAMITPSIKLTWADNRYMDTFYGVSEFQSIHSRFGRFHPQAGLKDISFGVTVMQMLSPRWFVFMGGKLKYLVGEAAESPVSRSNTNGTLIFTLGYRF